MFGQCLGVELRQAFTHFIDNRPADGIRRCDILDDFGPGDIARGKRFSEQILNVVDLGATPAHDLDECIMLTLRLLHPKYVVKQELVVVSRGEPLETQFGPVNQHFPELSYLGINTELGHLDHTPSRLASRHRHDWWAPGSLMHSALPFVSMSRPSSMSQPLAIARSNRPPLAI